MERYVIKYLDFPQAEDSKEAAVFWTRSKIHRLSVTTCEKNRTKSVE